jgi:predicted RNA methylase
MQKITDQEVLDVLRAMTCEGDLAILNSGQLERKLYEKVNKVLAALGGKWNRGRGGHVFPGSADTILKSVYEEGTYRDAKKEDAFFETPAEIAAEMVRLANVRAEALVLEPSAGHGAIVRALRAAAAIVETVEINPDFEPKLRAAGATEVRIGDFLTLPVRYQRYEAVVMNPPFSIAKRPTDTVHVLQAYKHLRPGGVLVAVTSLGWTFRDDRQSAAFRELVEEHGEYEENAKGTFKESGTEAASVVLVLRK